MHENLKRQEKLLLGGVVCACFLIRLVFLLLNSIKVKEIVSTDEAYYIQAGLNILAGKFYPAFGEANAGQPLFPLFLALGFKWGGEPILTARFLSSLAGAMTLIPFHLCVRSFFRSTDAFLSDWIFVLSPFAIRYSVLAMTHSLFNFFLVLMLLFLLKALKTNIFLWSIGAGLAGCGAYLTRVEGLAFVIFVLLGGFFLGRPALKLSLVSLLTFVLSCIPFWIWLRLAHGTWQLGWQEGQGVAGKFSSYWHVYLNNAFLYLPIEGAIFKLHGLGSFYLYLRELAKTYYLLLPRVLPILVWVLVGFGFLRVFSRKQDSARVPISWIILFASFPILFYPLFGIDARYLSPTGIFFAMFAGPGLQFLASKKKPWIPTAGLLIILINFIPGYGQLFAAGRDAPVEHKQAGEWIKNHVSEPQTIIASDKLSCFYAGPMCKRFVWMGPLYFQARQGASFEELLQKQKVDLVVADTRFMSRWPGADSLLKGPGSNFLVPLVEFTEGPEKIILYRFQGKK